MGKCIAICRLAKAMASAEVAKATSKISPQDLLYIVTFVMPLFLHLVTDDI